MRFFNQTSSFIYFVWVVLLGVFITTSCTNQTSSSNPIDANAGKLRVVATTAIIGDVVKQVGGALIDLEVLLPVGTDPHSFEPTPRDISKLNQADVIFINGAGLEMFLNSLIESSGGNFRIVDLSQEISLISLDEGQKSNGGRNDGSSYDPHVWMDPKNVVLWVEKISSILSELDKESAIIYEMNAKAYILELENLDMWIIKKVEEIPPENRELLTDHLDFGYFAKAYGFDQVGAIISAFSSQSQASAQELAALEDVITEKNVKVIFVSETVNPDLARRVADDTGIQLVSVYVGSLTDENGPANNYIDLLRYDVNAIFNGLR